MSNEAQPLTVTVTGQHLLTNPLTNKGTAFTIAERDALGLHGLLPTHVESIEERAARVRTQYALLETDLERHVLLRDVQGLDYDAIAAVVQCNKGTVKSRLSRAREHLRAVLEELGAFA